MRDDDEAVDDFTALFVAAFNADGRAEARLQAEKRLALSDAQRKRGARRTEQYNFRCSAAFRALAKATATARGISGADLMEEALAMYAAAHKIAEIAS